MIHPASHLSLTTFSRADGHSAVAAAAYRARTSLFDQRRGRRYTYRARGGLLSNELVGWNGTAEALWNAAEAAETRGNARVARELRPALPAELPLAAQIRLVRGMCLWLRDRYGVACQAAIHAPTFHDPDAARAFWARTAGSNLTEDDLRTLADPATTNRNFHAHILFTTRRVDPVTGEFLEKTRALDDRKQGPKELRAIRAEWEKRTNAELAKAGSKARIDTRSYADMAAAGDAPEGLMAQDHVGPRRTARRRRRVRKGGRDDTIAGSRRQRIRAHNEETWTSWLQLRALEREKARAEKESARIAARREAACKAARVEAERRIRAAKTPAEIEAALIAANHLDSLRQGDPWAMAIAEAFRKKRAPESERKTETEDPWSEEIDLETYVPDIPVSPPKEPFLKPQVQRVRTRVLCR